MFRPLLVLVLLSPLAASAQDFTRSASSHRAPDISWDRVAARTFGAAGAALPVVAVGISREAPAVFALVPIACAAGATIIGRASGDDGSFGGAFVGAAGGALFSVLAVAALRRVAPYDPDTRLEETDPTLAYAGLAVAAALAVPVGAAFGYSDIRLGAQPVQRGAVLTARMTL